MKLVYRGTEFEAANKEEFDILLDVWKKLIELNPIYPPNRISTPDEENEEKILAARYEELTGKRFRLRIEHGNLTRIDAIRSDLEKLGAQTGTEEIKPKFAQVG